VARYKKCKTVPLKTNIDGSLIWILKVCVVVTAHG